MQPQQSKHCASPPGRFSRVSRNERSTEKEARPVHQLFASPTSFVGVIPGKVHVFAVLCIDGVCMWLPRVMQLTSAAWLVWLELNDRAKFWLL